MALGSRMAAASAITSVSVSKPFFNPSLGQKISISLSLARSGSLSVLVLDRDGYPVQWVVRKKSVEQGSTSLDWDGRSDSGETMPNEAYSLKIDLESGGVTDSYFPALRTEGSTLVQTNYYDRRGGTLSYKLDKPSRVHVQAGTGVPDARKKTTSGPVLKTVVNREPRPAGMVAESWNGFDERGAIYVPALNHFVIGIAATPLPENSLIVSGGRGRTFLEWASVRTGVSLLPSAPADHHHHKGLTALDDASPKLVTSMAGAVWRPSERAWEVSAGEIRLTPTLEGPFADLFEKQPGFLLVFLDERQIATVPRPKSRSVVSVRIPSLGPGPHVLAVNWASDYGPAAVDSLRLIGAHAAGKPNPAAGGAS